MRSSQRTLITVSLTLTAMLSAGGLVRLSLALDKDVPGSSMPIASSQQKLNSDGIRILREGAKLDDETGHFRLDGDGATFVNSKGLEFGGLANLNLERVVRVLKNAEEAENIRWIVSGQVTEFSDQNYLLISRAVYKSATVPPVPDQLQ